MQSHITGEKRLLDTACSGFFPILLGSLMFSLSPAGEQLKSSELEQLLDSNLGSSHAKPSFSVTDFDLSFLTNPNSMANGTSVTTTTPANPSTIVPSNGFNIAITSASAVHATSSSSSGVGSASSSSSNGLSDEHPFRCGRCPYSSKNLNDLKQHFGSHVGEALKAPLKCTKCNFSCHESNQLRDHFQTIHAKKQSHDII